MIVSNRSLGVLCVLALCFGNPARAATIIVTQSGFGFTPQHVTIQVGDKVLWQWTSLPHTVTEGTDGVVDGNELFHGLLDAQNQVFEFTFDAAFVAANPRPNGVYDYFCAPHFPGMSGTVRLGRVGTPSCFGDGSTATACPCGNVGLTGRGCQNSASTGGARLEGHGATSPDALVLTSSGQLPTTVSVFLQGDVHNPNGIVFGDGVRCVAGSLKRLATTSASAGVVYYPHPGDLSISDRSAALGDPISPGSSRTYQVYYRDPDLGFCPLPAGNSFNVSSAVEISW